MSIPVLETERLLIREFRDSDLEVCHRILDLETHMEEQTIEERQKWLRWAIMNYRELEKLHQPPYGDYAMELKESGELIGSVGIPPAIIPWGVFPEFRAIGEPQNDFVQPEFGLFWAVSTAHWGKGYAGEAARAVIDFLFTQMKVRRVIAQTDSSNHNSQRVMEKLGMRLLHNASKEPFWLEVLAVLDNPAFPSTEKRS